MLSWESPGKGKLLETIHEYFFLYDEYCSETLRSALILFTETYSEFGVANNILREKRASETDIRRDIFTKVDEERLVWIRSNKSVKSTIQNGMNR